MNLTQLRKEAKKWQRELGLGNWKITVMWANPSDLAKEGDLGEMNDKIYGLNIYDPNHMVSTIKILHPKHDKHDLLETLVHELMHLFMFPLESAAGFSIKQPTDQWETAMEQSINKLTTLIVKETNGRTDNGNGGRTNQDCEG